MTAYIAIKIDAGGEIEPLGPPTKDRALAKAQAEQSLTGEVMRLVTDDFIDEDVERLIEDRAKQYRDETHEDLVLVPRTTAVNALGLAQAEVEELDINPDPNADPAVWKKTKNDLEEATQSTPS